MLWFDVYKYNSVQIVYFSLYLNYFYLVEEMFPTVGQKYTFYNIYICIHSLTGIDFVYVFKRFRYIIFWYCIKFASRVHC